MELGYLRVWRYSAGMVNWWILILGLVGMALLSFFVTARDPIAQIIGLSAVAAAGACVGGIQAAFTFSPADEPALELLLTAPRPLWMVIGERLLLVLVLNLGLAVVGAAIFTLMTGYEDVGTQLARWCAPCIAMMGLGMFISMTTRRSNYAVLCVILLVGAALFGGIEFLMRYVPSLWVIHPFLDVGRVSAGDYALNRVVLIFVGLALMGYSFLMMRDEEKLLAAQAD